MNPICSNTLKSPPDSFRSARLDVRIRKLLGFVLVQAILWLCGGSLPAALVQQLDATVTASVKTNSSGVVTNWVDQSGAANNALSAVGSVYYPSTSLSASGLAGVKFGPTRTSLTLFSAVASDSWLNCASNTNGFCVLLAFKCDGLSGFDWTDLLGNSSTTGTGFYLRYGGNANGGSYKVNLNGDLGINGTVAVGDTIVYALNYNAGSGTWTFWDSKSGSVQSGARGATDFSTANNVTLGSATSNTRYHNGMIGEVKVYDTALSAAAFKSERDALALKWANVAAPLNVNWRVISEDTNYPSDDVIVAAVAVNDPGFTNPLPADPANTDCTATFQEAIDAVNTAGGGTVFVPAGQYRFDGNLLMKNNVTLRGRWVRPSATQPVTGTILKIYNNRNNGSATAFITLQAAAGVRDLAFWHPDQTPTNIVPYPAVLASTSIFATAENVTLVNAYQGIDFTAQGDFLNVKNVFGSPLRLGFIVNSANSYPRIEGLNFSPDYWAWSGLAGSPVVGGPQANYTLTNGTAMVILEMDAGSILYCRASGYQVGLQFDRTYDSAGEQSVMNSVFTNCAEALRVVFVKDAKFVDCTFAGINYGIRHMTNGALVLTRCKISGGIKSVLDDDYVGKPGHSFDYQLCTLGGQMNVARAGELSLVDCSFTQTGTDVVLNSGVTGAIISGCTFADGQLNLTDNSAAPAGSVLTNNAAVVSQSPPLLPTAYAMVRKPDKTNFYNVMAYGAAGDGAADDTAAVQAALAAAQSGGGGIVFFPAGFYKMTGNLNVGAGIELRGIHGGRHDSESTTLGSVITINHGQGSDTGTPFITLGDRSGIRGLTFHYPNQNYLSPIKYPFMIRCQGFRNYLIDDASTNPYQAVDFTNAAEHLVEYAFFGAWKKAFQVGGGSANGRIQSLNVKWAFWEYSGLDGYPPSNLEHDRAEEMNGQTLDTFTLNDCTNETLVSIFNHACHNFITQNGGQGAAFVAAAESIQRGFVLNTNAPAGRFDFVACAANPKSQGDQLGKCAILVSSNFQGTAVFFNTYTRGNSEYLVSCAAGNLILQQGNFNSGGARGNEFFQVGGQVTMDNCFYDIAFDLDVPAGGSMMTKHVHFGNNYGNVDVAGVVSNSMCLYAGSIISADLNKAVPLARGLTMNTNNVERIVVNSFPDATIGTRSPLYYEPQMYGYHRVSGNTNSILFDVTNADFTNGAQPKVTLLVWYLDDTNGSFNVYYNSSTGERLARTFYTTNGDNTWTSKTIPVTNARFNSATNDIRIEVVSGDPVFCQVGVISTIFLGLPASATNSSTLYDIWANTYGGSSLIGSPTTDYDGDRLSNLGEYALGGNPTNRLDSGTAPVLVNASGTMLYIHPKRASDGNLVYTIETSTNLVSGSWINASYIITGTNVTGTGLNYLTNALTTNGKEAYYRLKIQMN